MRQYITAGRLSIGAGVIASGGALAILMQDIIKTRNLSYDQELMPVFVAQTIVCSYLTTSALRELKYLNALGFAAVFLIGGPQ